MKKRSKMFMLLVSGLTFCLAGGGCTNSQETVLGEEAEKASYDGSLEGFQNFIEANNKDWPPPSELQTFEGSNGAKLRYAHWPAPDPETRRGFVVFFQGRTEFIEKNIYAYRDLVNGNYEVWTLDWRGQGLSDRVLPDEPEKGHIDHFDTYLADAEIFLREIVKLHEVEGAQKILMAHSMGGAIGTLYLMKHQDAFDKAVFSSPMTKLPDLVDNDLIRAGNRTKIAVKPSACVGVFADCSWTSEFDRDVDVCAIVDQEPETYLLDRENTERYSHDIRKIAEIECLIAQNRPSIPSLGLGGSTSGWLRASFEATDRIAAHKADLKTPLLIIAGGNDDIVSNVGQSDFCDVDNPSCCRLEVEGAGHEVLIESEPLRAEFFDGFEAFVGSEATPTAFCAARR